MQNQMTMTIDLPKYVVDGISLFAATEDCSFSKAVELIAIECLKIEVTPEMQLEEVKAELALMKVEFHATMEIMAKLQKERDELFAYKQQVEAAKSTPIAQVEPEVSAEAPKKRKPRSGIKFTTPEELAKDATETRKKPVPAPNLDEPLPDETLPTEFMTSAELALHNARNQPVIPTTLPPPAVSADDLVRMSTEQAVVEARRKALAAEAAATAPVKYLPDEVEEEEEDEDDGYDEEQEDDFLDDI